MKSIFSFLKRKSTDPKATIGEFLSAFENYCADMLKVKNPDDVVEVLNKASTKMKGLIPQMTELTTTYPEIKDLQKGARLPEVFREFEQRFAGLGAKQMSAIGHAGKYLTDPKVIKPQKMFIEVMNEIIHYQEIGYLEV